MRGKCGNFFISTSKVLLWSCATFIMLSVAVSERQCYWCGPLAEQVHRSRRAPSCDVPTAHVTTCEAGLMHCAVVATSPPHVESRFCVKLYQDECYPLFCNSTKTWKMTCPCRGNLCNGNNTEREIEAFAVLSKLVAKSQNARIKRASDQSNFISIDRERTLIITNLTQLQSNQTKPEVNEIGNTKSMIVITSTVREDTVNEALSTEIPTNKTVTVNLTSKTPDFSQKLEQLNHTTDDTTVQGELKSDPEELTTAIPYADLNATAETTIPDKSDTIAITETTKASDMVEEIDKADNKIVKEPETTKEAVINETITESNTKESATNIPKPAALPSEQLPTAEALQQNASPSPTTSKTTEVVKAESTEPSTFETDNGTTVEPTKAHASYIRLLPTYFYPIIFALLLITH